MIRIFNIFVPMITLSGIYRIDSKAIGLCVYVGSSMNITNRFRQHKYDLRSGTGGEELQYHVNKYGIDDLVFSVVEGATEQYLRELETYYCKKLNPLYNICTPGGRRSLTDKVYLNSNIDFLDKVKYCLAKNRRIKNASKL